MYITLLLFSGYSYIFMLINNVLEYDEPASNDRLTLNTGQNTARNTRIASEIRGKIMPDSGDNHLSNVICHFPRPL